MDWIKVAQQWPFHTGAAKNAVVAQFIRIGVSAVPILQERPGGFQKSCWSSVNIGNPY